MYVFSFSLTRIAREINESKEGEGRGPFMEDTAFRTFLSQPTQSIFTFISTVFKKSNGERRNKSEFNQ